MTTPIPPNCPMRPIVPVAPLGASEPSTQPAVLQHNNGSFNKILTVPPKNILQNLVSFLPRQGPTVLTLCGSNFNADAFV